MSKELLERWTKYADSQGVPGTVIGRQLVERFLDGVEGKATEVSEAPDLDYLLMVLRHENDLLYGAVRKAVRQELTQVLLLSREQLEASLSGAAVSPSEESKRHAAEQRKNFDNLKGGAR